MPVKCPQQEHIQNFEYNRPLQIIHYASNRFIDFNSAIQSQNLGFKIQLTYNKRYWKVQPCYKYQTKLTQKLFFGQQIYVLENNTNRQMELGFISCTSKNNKNYIIHQQALVGAGNLVKCKFNYFSKYQNGLYYGQFVRVFHHQSQAFLIDYNPPEKQSDFQQKKAYFGFNKHKQQSLNNLLEDIWMIYQPIQNNLNGQVKFGDCIALQNLITGRFVSLYSNYEWQLIIVLSSKCSQLSSMITNSLQGEETGEIKNLQTRLKFNKNNKYLAVNPKVQKNKPSELIVDQIAQQQHFVEFKTFTRQSIIMLNFIKSYRKLIFQFNLFFSDQQIQIWRLEIIKKQYDLIHITKNKIQLKSIHDKNIYNKQMNASIPKLIKYLQKIHIINLNTSQNQQKQYYIKQIIINTYRLLHYIASQNDQAKKILFSSIHIFLNDIFMDYYAQELLIIIFQNNLKFLTKISKIIFNKQSNIIQSLLKSIQHSLRQTNQNQYNSRIIKIINIFIVLTRYKFRSVYENQILIAEQLFKKPYLFDIIFFKIQILKSKIVIHLNNHEQINLQKIKQKSYELLIQKLFQLLSSICQNRNSHVKFIIQKYLYNNKRSKIRQNLLERISILNPKIRDNIMLFLYNQYIDNNYRTIPLFNSSVLKTKYLQKNQESQLLQLQTRFKQSIASKFQNSNQSSPLNTKRQLNKSFQPSYDQWQIKLFKDKLLKLIIKKQGWNQQMFKILYGGLQMNMFSSQQIQILISQVIIQIPKLTYQSSSIYAIKILQNINLRLQNLLLQHSNLYFLIINNPFLNKNISNHQQLTYFTTLNANIYKNSKNQQIQKYIQCTQKIKKFQKIIKKQEIIKILINFNFELPTMLQLFISSRNILNIFQNQVQLLKKCSFINSYQIDQYKLLYNSYQNLKKLNKISSNWLNSIQSQPQQLRIFIKIISQVTNFMFQNFNFNEQYVSTQRKKSKLSIIRQNLIKNIGFHQQIIDFIKNNRYLLYDKLLKDVIKKIRQSFQISFDFLYHFCKDYTSNINIIINYSTFLTQFINLPQVGQTKLNILLLHNQIKLIRKITQNNVIQYFMKILKDKNQETSNCSFSPSYIQQILKITSIQGKLYQKTILYISNFLQDKNLLKKLLFLRQSTNKRYKLNLQLLKVKLDPCQIPIFYHAKIIKLLNLVMIFLGKKRNQLKYMVRQFIDLEYVFQILSQYDVFTHYGIPSQMNFILKKQLFILLDLYLQMKDISKYVLDSKTIDSFLDFYISINDNINKKQSFSQNQIIFLPYLQQFELQISFYSNNFQIFFWEFLRPVLDKIDRIFDNQKHKQTNPTYIRLVKLLSSKKKKIQNNNNKTYIPPIESKWQNFIIMPNKKLDDDQVKLKNSIFNFLNKERQVKISFQKQSTQIFQVFYEQQQVLIVFLQKYLQKCFKKVNEQHLLNLISFLQFIYQYLQYSSNKKIQLLSKRLKQIQINSKYKNILYKLFRFILIDQFNFNHFKQRQIFYHVLKIINLLIIKLDSQKIQILQQIYKILIEKGFNILKIIKIIIQQNQIHTITREINKQINIALKYLKFTGQYQTKPFNLIMKFLKQICKNQNICLYLRNKKVNQIVDLLQILIKSFKINLGIDKKKQQFNLILIQKTTLLCQVITAFYQGFNKTNQLYIVDPAMIRCVENILKFSNFMPNKQKFLSAQIQQKFKKQYKYTISNFNDLIEDKISYINYQNNTTLNLLKLSVLKLLQESIIKNQLTQFKLRAKISLQILKINLIWIYEDCLSLTRQQKQNQYLFLQRQPNWLQIYQNQKYIYPLFCHAMYCYVLIHKLEIKQIKIEKIENKSKYSRQQKKQKQIPKHIQQFLNQVKEIQYQKNIITFFQQFQKSLKFFQQYLLTVQININQQISQQYFLKLPFCYMVTNQIKNQFRNSCNRINRQQKMKSFKKYQKQLFIQLQQQKNKNQQIVQLYPKFQNILQFMWYLPQIVLGIWFITIFIAIIFLQEDHTQYLVNINQYNFAAQFFQFMNPSSFFGFWLFFFTIIQIIFGIIIMINFILKKFPLVIKIAKINYQQTDQKQLKGLNKYLYFYLFKHTFPKIAPDLYYIFFSFLSMFHPLFGCFLLLVIVPRFQMGITILKAVSQTWFMFVATTGTFLVFDIVFSYIVYVTLSYNGASYSSTCTDLLRCFKLISDQTIKGLYPLMLPKNWINNTLTYQLTTQLIYMILGNSLTLVFASLIIDKFSQLRQEEYKIKIDQQNYCYLCEQRQFQINFQLQGFEKHIQSTHNTWNYIFFQFYLRKKTRQKYNLIEEYVINLKKNDNWIWIPEKTSRLKKAKDKAFQQENKKKQINQMLQKQCQQLKLAKKILEDMRKSWRYIFSSQI